MTPAVVFESARAAARRAPDSAIVVATIPAPGPPRSFSSPLVAWEPAPGPAFVGWGEGAPRRCFEASNDLGARATRAASRSARVVDVGEGGRSEVSPARSSSAASRSRPTASAIAPNPGRRSATRASPCRPSLFGSGARRDLALPGAPRRRGGPRAGAESSTLEKAALALADAKPEARPRAATIEWPAQAPWTRTIEDALACIDDRVFHKVVAAAVCRVACGDRPSLERALARLRAS